MLLSFEFLADDLFKFQKIELLGWSTNLDSLIIRGLNVYKKYLSFGFSDQELQSKSIKHWKNHAGQPLYINLWTAVLKRRELNKKKRALQEFLGKSSKLMQFNGDIQIYSKNFPFLSRAKRRTAKGKSIFALWSS